MRGYYHPLIKGLDSRGECVQKQKGTHNQNVGFGNTYSRFYYRRIARRLALSSLLFGEKAGLATDPPVRQRLYNGYTKVIQGSYNGYTRAIEMLYKDVISCVILACGTSYCLTLFRIRVSGSPPEPSSSVRPRLAASSLMGLAIGPESPPGTPSKDLYSPPRSWRDRKKGHTIERC